MKKQLKLQQIDLSKCQDIDEAQIVEKDLRKPVQDTSIHPYNGIGRIVSRIYDPETEKYVEKSGTAFIVALNLILTSTHVLKLKNCKALSDDIQFFPEQLLRKEQISQRGIKAQMIHIRSDFKDSEDQTNRKLDFALIQIQQNNIITQDQILPLDFSYQFKVQDKFNITGYGGSGVFGSIQTYEQNNAVEQKDDLLFYQHTTNQGNSGSPVLLKKQKGKYVVVGIHKGSKSHYNYCILLKCINSSIANNSSVKVLTCFNSKDLQQKWPEKYIRSRQSNDKTLKQLNKKIRELQQKLQNAENTLKQKDKEVCQLKENIYELQQKLKKSDNDKKEKDRLLQQFELQNNKLKQQNNKLNQNLKKYEGNLKEKGIKIIKLKSQKKWSAQLLVQSLILDLNGLEWLTKWMQKPVDKIQLKFTASKNGFSLNKYFETCGDLKNTIIIVKNQKGKIFGGYTPLSFNPSINWTSRGESEGIKDTSNSSFVFSLSTKQKQKFDIYSDKYAIVRWKDKRNIFFFGAFAIKGQQNKYNSNISKNMLSKLKNSFISSFENTSSLQQTRDMKFYQACFILGDTSSSYNTSKYPATKQFYKEITGQQDQWSLISQCEVYQVIFE